MLVLTRHLGQSINIGDDLEITVVEIRGDQIRLGINAPKNVTVDRKEIWEQKQAEKADRSAAK